MDVQLAKENEDGSAVFTFDMTPEETRAMVILGLKTAILAGIESAKDWDGESDLNGLRDGTSDLEELQEGNAGLSD
jgi:hypothetical protein